MGERYQKTKRKLKNILPHLIVVMIIILVASAYLFNSIVITIHSGEGGVLYKRFSGGTVIDKVYAEGIHFIFPWNIMFIYNVRVQQIAHEFDVLTKNGLKVHLAISIRYYPEYDLIGVLHKKVGPQYVETVVIPEIENVLRILIGRLDAQEVYTTERSIIEKSLNEAVEQVAQRFIIVDDVLIKKMRLPPKVEQAIQNKLEQKHLADAHDFIIEKQKKEAERKRIEGQGMRAYNDIVNKSLSNQILQWMAIQATLELSKSDNTKVVVVGSGKRGLPVFGNLLLDAPGNVSFGGDANAAAPSVKPDAFYQGTDKTGTSQPVPENDTPETPKTPDVFYQEEEADFPEPADKG
ncbi:prohibitin family protein [Desulfobacterales bacterium HSG2]|nr:prohibitin family protein [Desulfobacterales bacterium HSG2]